jgi:uncharacterized protein YbjT (DUF2867 family)
MTAPELLITGVTGTTGGATAAALSARGVRYRAVTRRPELITDPAAEAVAAEFDDAETLRRALDGVRAAYLVSPSTEKAEAQQRRFIDVARAVGVEHIVLLSQFAARADSPVRFLRYHAAVEEHLSASGIGGTSLRPNLFMQGLLAMAVPIAVDGTLPAPIGDAAVSVIDARDIGEVAAEALTATEPLGTLTLTGPESLGHAAIAAALTRALGRPVRFIDVAPDAFAAALAGVVPAWQLDGLVEDYAHYAAGEARAVTTAVPDVLGRPARDIDAFARDYAAAFHAAGTKRSA